MELIKNTFILPARLFELFNETRHWVVEPFCPDGEFYIADREGRIHWFTYHGRLGDQPRFTEEAE